MRSLLGLSILTLAASAAAFVTRSPHIVKATNETFDISGVISDWGNSTGSTDGVNVINSTVDTDLGVPSEQCFLEIDDGHYARVTIFTDEVIGYERIDEILRKSSTSLRDRHSDTFVMREFDYEETGAGVIDRGFHMKNYRLRPGERAPKMTNGDAIYFIDVILRPWIANRDDSDPPKPMAVFSFDIYDKGWPGKSIGGWMSYLPLPKDAQSPAVSRRFS